MSFKDLGLIEPLLKALGELGQQTPTAIQSKAIPAALRGRDIIAASQTGTGKTASFALPLIHLLSDAPEAAANSIHALVLVPTRELAQQVSDTLRGYTRHIRMRVFAAYGGVSINPQMMALRRGADILVATPGRLLDLQEKNALRLGGVRLLVLDEADRMLDMGFSKDITAILALLPARRQTMLFSATYSDPMRALASTLLRQPLEIDATPRNTAVGTIRQSLIPVDKQRKLELFCHLLRTRRWQRLLVFAKTRKRVEEVLTSLRYSGVASEAIHGEIAQHARLAALRRFNAGETRVLVATDVAARGLDIASLPLVVNLDLPVAAEGYVHRIGRTARAGEVGEAITLVCADEAPQLAAIETLIGKQLPRREVEGFEPKHRVPATGPNKHPPARPTGKDTPRTRAQPAKNRKTKKKKAAGGKPAAPASGRRARQKPRPG